MEDSNLNRCTRAACLFSIHAVNFTVKFTVKISPGVVSLSGAVSFLGASWGEDEHYILRGERTFTLLLRNSPSRACSRETPTCEKAPFSGY